MWIITIPVIMPLFATPFSWIELCLFEKFIPLDVTNEHTNSFPVVCIFHSALKNGKNC